MRNYFTFDGVDSRSFGVYISGQGTFKAPARSYDALEIPGRNGALLGIDSRLGNVELTYPAFIYSNFAENIAAFRAFLLSHKGYFKLKDSYHPDEFRLAYYPGPFEPDVTSANNAGSFDITFICKPQRYLESGEEVIELIPGQSETHTYTGNPASFVAQNGDQITSLQIPLRFFQDLHGYSHPWPAGGGVNILPAISQTGNGFINDYRLLSDGTTTFAGTYYISEYIPVTPGKTYTYSVRGYGSETSSCAAFYDSEYNFISAITGKPNGNEAVAPSNAAYMRASNTKSGAELYYTLNEGPYANICPISGLTGLSVYVSPTQDPDDATVYNVDWTTQAGTVYGGTLDVVTGVLTENRITYAFDGTESFSNYTSAIVCNKDMPVGYSVTGSDILCSHSTNAYIRFYNSSKSRVQFNKAYFGVSSVDELKTLLANWNTAGTPLQYSYELATPLTYQLTPTQIAALLAGETFVWSSNNEAVTVEVSSVIPTILENPTLFDALPFLRVYGTGILGIGSHTITITAADVYTDIDCEMMDCFKGSANKNQYVQFSGNDFPTLEPGVNGFSFSGITKVEVKPRWWSV